MRTHKSPYIGPYMVIYDRIRVHICVYTYIYIDIDIHIYRERERNIHIYIYSWHVLTLQLVGTWVQNMFRNLVSDFLTCPQLVGTWVQNIFRNLVPDFWCILFQMLRVHGVLISIVSISSVSCRVRILRVSMSMPCCGHPAACVGRGVRLGSESLSGDAGSGSAGTCVWKPENQRIWKSRNLEIRNT